MTPLLCACGKTTFTMLGDHGETRFVLYRKDRITLPPPDRMASFRLTPRSSTRRVLATCCNTPLFLEFKGGHWLSLYAGLWPPPGTAPAPTLRSMTPALPDRAALPHDIPNAKTRSAGFMWALLTAWVAMGFRSPKVPVTGEICAWPPRKNRSPDRIEIRNAVSPGHVTHVDRAKYMAMRQALLAVLPDAPPGPTVAEAQAALLPHLDPILFPGGAKAGWWMKCVQLDLEARGTITRGPKPPVRLHRTGNVG